MFKKFLIIILTIAFTLNIMTLIEAEAMGVSVNISGHSVNFTEDSGAPFIDSANRTQTPFRQTLEEFGAVVKWDQTNEIAVAEKNGIVVKAPIGANYIYKNNVKIPNDTAALNIGGRTYLPIRVVLEAFGANVSWNQAKYQVNVTMPELDGPYKVIRVVDGDTVILNVKGIEERVRLIGIDTPESVNPDATKNVPYGEVASNYAKAMLEGKEVLIEMDVQERDQYGRLLAYVYIEYKMFNKTLLEGGHAMVATFPPNVKYVDAFTALQKKARDEGKGLWTY